MLVTLVTLVTLVIHCGMAPNHENANGRSADWAVPRSHQAHKAEEATHVSTSARTR